MIMADGGTPLRNELEKVAISNALPLEAARPPVVLDFNHMFISHPRTAFQRNRTIFGCIVAEL